MMRLAHLPILGHPPGLLPVHHSQDPVRPVHRDDHVAALQIAVREPDTHRVGQLVSMRVDAQDARAKAILALPAALLGEVIVEGGGVSERARAAPEVVWGVGEGLVVDLGAHDAACR